MPADYVRAVERAGGRPLLVPPSDDGVEETLDVLDGVIFSGGSDLDPVTYGQDAHPETYGIVAERDRAELALLQAALARDMPVLAVCRGSQVLNVALGGDLVQHLPEVVGDHKHKHTPGEYADHDVATRPGDAARLAARRPRAGEVASPPGLRARSARACARRRGPTTARSRRWRTPRGASPSASSGTRRRARTCGSSRRSSTRRAPTARAAVRPDALARDADPDDPGARCGSSLRNARLDVRPCDLAARPLPDFLIIGAQKAGTTALYAYLREHPAITGPSWKEVSFFDRHYGRGEAWYRGNFPNRRAHARDARRRGEPELPLPPARAGTRRGARARRAADRARAEPGRPRALALPPRGRARTRAALVRGGARRRGRRECTASSSACATRATSATRGGTTRTRHAVATRSSSSAGSRSSRASSCWCSRATISAATRARRTRRVLEFLGAPPHELDVVPARLRARVRADETRDARAAGRASSPSRTAGSTSYSAATSAGGSAARFAVSASVAGRRRRAAGTGGRRRPSSASQPPTAGPTTLPAAQAPFIAPKARPGGDSRAARPRR